jgi:hypothetical protein
VRPKDADEVLGKMSTNTSVPGKGRRFITKEAITSVIGPTEEIANKQVVIMSAKDLTES